MNPEQVRSPRWLKLAQITWVFLTLFVLVAFVRAAPIFYKNHATLCTLKVEVCAQSWLLTPGQLELLQTIHMSVQGWAAYTLVTRGIEILVFLILGTFIFVRKRSDSMALLVAFFFITWGTSNGVTQELTKVGSGLEPLLRFTNTLGWICLILFFSVFPNGKFVPRFIRWVAIAFISYFLFGYLFPQTAERINDLGVGALLFLSLFVTMLVAQFYRYKWVSTPIERKQTKWVVFGIVVMSGCFIAISLFSSNFASSLLLLLLIGGQSIIIIVLPLSIGMAILRSSLFDIDVIIRKTLLYGTRSVLLGLVFIGAVVVLQELFGRVSGQANSPLAIVISTLAIAALFNPLRARLQNIIDRRFFRQKYNAEQALAAFAKKARDEVEIERLTAELVKVFQETMQPVSVQLAFRKAGT